MAYLDKIVFKEDFRNLEAGLEIEFTKPITLLMGENGSGKSTVLDMLRDHYGISDPSYFKGEGHGSKLEIYDSGLTKDDVKYFDFHAEDSKFAASFREDMMSQLQAQKLSSGLGLAVQFGNTEIMKSKEKLILLDEPDRGMALKVQQMYKDVLPKVAVLHDNQMIISTHSFLIMQLAEKDTDLCGLYSMDEKKYITKEEFIDNHIFGGK